MAPTSASAPIQNPLSKSGQRKKKLIGSRLRNVIVCSLCTLGLTQIALVSKIFRDHLKPQQMHDGFSNDKKTEVTASGTSMRALSSQTTTTEDGSASVVGGEAANPLTVVGYAVSLTGCGSDQLTDGAAVLKHSIHLSSIHNKSSGSKYSYRMYAIVHPSALSCAGQLKDAGYTILERETPVDVSEIQGKFLRTKVVTNGCCGDKEYIKLHAYTLIEHPIVVHLDLDTVVLKPLDAIFDVMMDPSPQTREDQTLFESVLYRQDEIEGRHVFTTKTPSMPGRVDAFFTRDYNMQMPTKKNALVQGGFLVLRPSMDTYTEFQDIIRKGDFRGGRGWGGMGYTGYGAMTFQGIIPYYYDQIKPNTAVELNRCIYNQMCDNPRTKRTEGDVVSGDCRDGRENCEDCRSVSLDLVKTAHFTLCQKPWNCMPHQTDNLQHRLCRSLHHEWFRIRNDLEQQLSLQNPTRSVASPGKYNPDHFYGYCNFGSAKGYIPISLPSAAGVKYS